MKAVSKQIGAAELARRKRQGVDRWDEVWNGVLHMSPAPATEHQRIVSELNAFLLPLLKSRKTILLCGVNVFDESSAEENYRIPDFSIVAAGRDSIIKPDGIRGGGPDAVIEVVSPGDESFEKFPFFARLRVRELILIDRDTKKPELYRLSGARYRRSVRAASEILGVRFRSEANRLIVEDLRNPALRIEI